jgi:4-aminobutyrate aminotransferase-like enzyme
LVLGKAIGGGLPLGAILSSLEVAESFEFHDFSSTTGGNPLACVAGLESLKIIHEEKLYENAEEMGDYLMRRLNEIKEKNNLIGDVRGKGLIVGIELVKDAKKTPAIKEARQAFTNATENGLLITLAGESVLRLLPPLNVTREHVDQAVEILEKSLGKI